VDLAGNESKVYIEDLDILGQDNEYESSPNLRKLKLMELAKIFNFYDLTKDVFRMCALSSKHQIETMGCNISKGK